MSMGLRNDAQVRAVMGKALGVALREVGFKARDCLIDTINAEVYGTGGSDWYERTMELLTSWDFTSQINLFMSSFEIEFQPSNLSVNQPAWQHGSLVGGGTDISASFAEIINEGFNDVLFGNGQPRPFWDVFVKEFNSKVRRWFKTACAGQGLRVV